MYQWRAQGLDFVFQSCNCSVTQGPQHKGPAALCGGTWAMSVLPSPFRRQITATVKQRVILQPLQRRVKSELIAEAFTAGFVLLSSYSCQSLSKYTT